MCAYSLRRRRDFEDVRAKLQPGIPAAAVERLKTGPVVYEAWGVEVGGRVARALTTTGR
jgi:hypothetical protein